jgi:hypothetical protein
MNNFILAASTTKDKDVGNKRLLRFENEADHETQLDIVVDDSLDKQNEVI